jgi:hypothetical protein
VFTETLTYKKPIPLPHHISTLIKKAVGHVRLAPEEVHPPEYIPANARKASALGLMKSYRVYVLLQHLNRHQFSGRGKFVLTPNWLDTLAAWLDLSPVTLKRTLRKMIAEGIFLRAHSRLPYVALVGREALSARLAELAQQAYDPAPYEMSYRKEVLSLKDFASLKRFSAMTLNGWLRVAAHSQKRLRWEDLEPLWGRTRPTLNDWIEIADIRKIYNIAYFEPPGPCPEDIHTWMMTLRGKDYVCIQRANTYVSEGLSKQAKRGVCRKAAARMCEASENGGESLKHPRTNWPYIELAPEKRARSFKRMRKAIAEHPDRTYYRHDWDRIGLRTGRTYQIWHCPHRAIHDPVTQWEWELKRTGWYMRHK